MIRNRTALELIVLEIALLAHGFFAWADRAVAEELQVDCARVIGTIRPLHGVNNGPVNDGETLDLSEDYRALGIPLARLHDSEWPNPDLVDMHAIFPDLRADPELPASYRFLRTDDYIRPIIATGTGIVYRLGESIEHSRRKYHVAPPADYEQWSAACLGVIRHYNEGWADGFRYGIRYWEIWNEPENRPAMWTGSDEDYYRLYRTAARKIKGAFPALMVGGPAVGATGEVVDGRLQPTAFLEGFLTSCKADDVPLDFFSWHTYTDDPYLYARKAWAIRQWLDDHELARTEIHLNEWNYLPDNDWGPMLGSGQALRRQQWYEKMGGPQGAAFIACVLLYLQDAPIDVANLYGGDSGSFGLFNRYGVPKKTFHAVRAFKMLLDTPVRLAASGSRPGETAISAGMNQEKTAAAVLVSNYRAADGDFELVVDHLPWDGPTQWQCLRVDGQHDLENVEAGIAVAGTADVATTGQLRLPCRLPAPGVLLIQLRPQVSQ